MKQIRWICGTALVLDGLAGAACWFAAYASSQHPHGPIFGLMWALSVLGISFGVSIVAAAAQSESFVHVVQVRAALFLGVGTVLAAIVGLIAATPTPGPEGTDGFIAAIFPSAYAAGLLASIPVIILVAGRDNWLATPKSERGVTPISRAS